MITTQYQPRKGDLTGPLFNLMTSASLWVIGQPDQTEWFVELVRAEELGESFDEFTARKDLEQAETDEQKEIERSQNEDLQAWRQS